MKRVRDGFLKMETKEDLEYLHKQAKSCSVLPRVGSQGGLKMVLECLRKQVTEAKKQSVIL